MSAAFKGNVLPYIVVAPTAADLNNFEFGRRVYQTQSRFYSAQPQFSEWYVSQRTTNDPVLMTPLQAKYINNRSQNITPQRLQADFVIRPRTF